MPSELAGGVLLLGAVVCAVRVPARAAALPLTAALVCAAVEQLGDPATDALRLAACALAGAGIVLLVLERSGRVSRLSWLDAAMGASSSAALCLTVGGSGAAAVAAAGVLGGVALSRWRPGPRVLAAGAGAAALAAGAALAPAAAVCIAAAAWLREPPPKPVPEFSRVVLCAILAFATTALTLLTLGQFETIHDLAVVLATVTVLAGMARAGLPSSTACARATGRP